MLFTVYETFTPGASYSGELGEDARGKFVYFSASEIPKGMTFAGKILKSKNQQYHITYSKFEKNSELGNAIIKAYF